MFRPDTSARRLATSSRSCVELVGKARPGALRSPSNRIVQLREARARRGRGHTQVRTPAARRRRMIIRLAPLRSRSPRKAERHGLTLIRMRLDAKHRTPCNVLAARSQSEPPRTGHYAGFPTGGRIFSVWLITESVQPRWLQLSGLAGGADGAARACRSRGRDCTFDPRQSSVARTGTTTTSRRP